MKFGQSDIRICGTLYGTSFRSTKWRSFNCLGMITLPLAIAIHTCMFVSLAINFISNSLPARILFATIYVPCFVLAMVSLFRTTTTDPGAVPMGARPLISGDGDGGGGDIEMMETATPPTFDEVVESKSLMLSGENREDELSQSKGELSVTTTSSSTTGVGEGGIPCCNKCNGNYKPPRAHHDQFTGRCIIKLDHYCPWVCNAIGALNQKFFVLFLFYTLILCITSVGLVMMRYNRCEYRFSAPNVEGLFYNPNVAGCKDPSSWVIVLTCIGSIWFTIVSVVNLGSQWPAVTTGIALVARKKIRQGMADPADVGRVRDDLNEMFGGTSDSFALHWLLPLEPRFPEGVKEEILGYKVDCSLC